MTMQSIANAGSGRLSRKSPLLARGVLALMIVSFAILLLRLKWQSKF